MALLSEPMEFLDLENGNSVTVQITGYEYGTASIAPRITTSRHVAIHMAQNNLATAPPPGHPVTIDVPVTRINITRIDKPSPVPYYDISAKTLQAQLKPLLDSGAYRSRTFKITANGEKPSKRYSVEAI